MGLTSQVLTLLQEMQVPNKAYYITCIGETIWIHHPYDEHLVEVDRQLRGRRYDRKKKCSFTDIKFFDDVVARYSGEHFYFHESFIKAVTRFTEIHGERQSETLLKLWKEMNGRVYDAGEARKALVANHFRELTDYDLEEDILPEGIVPFKHQRVGIGFLTKVPYGLLGDEMGLGKTMQAILACHILLRKEVITHVVVVCPNPLKLNWYNEILKFSNADPKSISVVEGPAARRRKKIAGSFTWLIINYESLRVEIDNLIERFESVEFAIVGDESHKIKSQQAKQSIATYKLGRLAVRRYLLTGTLVANKPEDVWNQIRFLDDAKLLGDWRDFRKRYCVERDFKFGRRFVRKIVGYHNLDQLKDNIGRVMLRRTKDECLDLPDKIYQTMAVQMTAPQRKFYKRVCDGIVSEMRQESGKTVELNDILTKMLYALEVASNPALVNPPEIVARIEEQIENEESGRRKKQMQKRLEFWQELETVDASASGKLSLLDELLESHIEEENKKVIVWTFFVKNIEMFAERYQGYNPVVFYGKTSTEDRKNAVENFQNNDDVKLFIGNPQAAGIGLTLTASSVAIFFDRNFSAVDFKQAVDRIHRIGQSQTCNIITLQSDQSIDKYVEHLIAMKDKTSAFLQGDKSDPIDDENGDFESDTSQSSVKVADVENWLKGSA